MKQGVMFINFANKLKWKQLLPYIIVYPSKQKLQL